jgi:hypothetical protein
MLTKLEHLLLSDTILNYCVGQERTRKNLRYKIVDNKRTHMRSNNSRIICSIYIAVRMATV